MCLCWCFNPLNDLTLGSIGGCWLLPRTWTPFTHISQWDRFVRICHQALLQGHVVVWPEHQRLLTPLRRDASRLMPGRSRLWTWEENTFAALCLWNWDSTFVSWLSFRRTPQAGFLSSEGPFVCSSGSRQQMYSPTAQVHQKMSCSAPSILPCHECTLHVTYLYL